MLNSSVNSTARVEVPSIAPDANPYQAIYTLLKTGLEGPQNGFCGPEGNALTPAI